MDRVYGMVLERPDGGDHRDTTTFEIVGPFASVEEADAFMAQCPYLRAEWCGVISPEMVRSPEDVAAEWQEYRDDFPVENTDDAIAQAVRQRGRS